MSRSTRRALAGSFLAAFLLGTSATGLADDAKKRELALAKCAANYKAALTACENVALAEACYKQADSEDLACRKAQGAAGHSKVEPGVDKRPGAIGPLPIQNPDPRLTIKKPLNCGTGINPTCADGHARFPGCGQSTSQAAQASQGIGGNTPTIIQDSNGDKDVCTGNPLSCPAGFTLIARKGQDLCWDSVENKAKYQY